MQMPIFISPEMNSTQKKKKKKNLIRREANTFLPFTEPKALEKN